MTRAYSEAIAERAYDSLGRMLDFAVRSLHIDAGTMMDLFIASSAADAFGRGDIRLICGMSGTELAYEILDRAGLSYERTVPRHTTSLSNEYWCGYVLARMQRESCMRFDEIIKSFSPSGIIAEFSGLRLKKLDSLPLTISEAEKAAEMLSFGRGFAGEMCARLAGNCSGTALKALRKKNKLSQSELASLSGIPVRTIQQYEQGQKDLRKARSEYIIALSRALNCEPSRLLCPAV